MGLNFDELLGGGYAWDGAAPATPDEVERLQAWTPELPRNLVNLLKRSDGGLATLKNGQEITIWSVGQLLELPPEDGFIPFANDGPTIFKMDSRNGFPYPVYADFQQVSKCFGSFFDLRPR